VPSRSAGVLLFRLPAGVLEVLLVHPGGPFWAKKDAAAWSIPKGEYGEDEDPRAAAFRELKEETGWSLTGEAIPLEPIRQASGKLVQAWALEADVDPITLKSNCFSMEWPPRSGRQREFPEVDRAEWFSVDAARARINPAQAVLLDRLVEHLRETRG
jgi:predicted NUDIX family NTP pyrophosphohydrolase